MLTDNDKQAIIQAYQSNVCSVAELGKQYGVSRQAIYKLLRSADIDTSGKPLGVPCIICGGVVLRHRKKIRDTNSCFCSRACYYQFLKRGNYKPHRYGSKQAREIVAALYPLQPEMIVHHIDGDQNNNELNNLLVFKNQTDHIRHHRGFKIEPLKTF